MFAGEWFSGGGDVAGGIKLGKLPEVGPASPDCIGEAFPIKLGFENPRLGWKLPKLPDGNPVG